MTQEAFAGRAGGADWGFRRAAETEVGGFGQGSVGVSGQLCHEVALSPWSANILQLHPLGGNLANSVSGKLRDRRCRGTIQTSSPCRFTAVTVDRRRSRRQGPSSSAGTAYGKWVNAVLLCSPKPFVVVLCLWGSVNSAVAADGFAEALQTKHQVRFFNTPLEDALNTIRKKWGVTVDVAEGVHTSGIVNFEADGELFDVLASVVSQCGLSCGIGHEMLEIEKLSLRQLLEMEVHLCFRRASLQSVVFQLQRQFDLKTALADGLDRKLRIDGCGYGPLQGLLERILARNGLALQVTEGEGEDEIEIVRLERQPTPDELMKRELFSGGPLKCTKASLVEVAALIPENWNVTVEFDAGVDPMLRVTGGADDQSLHDWMVSLLQPHDLTYDVVAGRLRIMHFREPAAALELEREVDFISLPLRHAIPYLQPRFQVKISLADDVTPDLPIIAAEKQKLKEMLTAGLVRSGLKYTTDGKSIHIMNKTFAERLAVEMKAEFHRTRLQDVIAGISSGYSLNVSLAERINRRLLIDGTASGPLGDVLSKTLEPYHLVYVVQGAKENSLLIQRARPATPQELIEETLESESFVFDFEETSLEDAVQTISERYGINVKIGSGVNQLLTPGRGSGPTLKAALTELLRPHNLRTEIVEDTVMIVQRPDPGRGFWGGKPPPEALPEAADNAQPNQRGRPGTPQEMIEKKLESKPFVFDFMKTPLKDAVQTISELYGIKVKIGSGVNPLLTPGRGSGMTLKAALADLLQPNGLRAEIEGDTLVIMR